MYTPSREEFVAAAARGNLIPVYRELLADADTPVSAYAALGGGEHSFLLEYVVGGSTWAAYSFVGVAPRALQPRDDGAELHAAHRMRLWIEEDLGMHDVVRGGAPEVGLQRILGGEPVRPVVVGEEGVGVEVVLRVHPGGGIGVLVPRAADVAAALDDLEVVSGLFEPDAGEQPGHASADHQDLEMLRRRIGPDVRAAEAQFVLEQRKVARRDLEAGHEVHQLAQLGLRRRAAAATATAHSRTRARSRHHSRTVSTVRLSSPPQL